MIRLSIIIPHYNSFDLLEKLINSIPILAEIETIVIDDKSDDGDEQISQLAKKYPHVNFLHNKGHKGAAACRNIGLSQAQGHWLLFADADDFFLDGLYKQVSAFFDSDHEVVFFLPTSIELGTDKQSDRHLPYEKIMNDFLKNKNDLFLRYRIAVPWSKLIKRNFITENKISFDEVLASNDVMFSAKVGHLMKNFTVCSTSIYCVTTNKGSLTNKMSEKILDARVNVFIDYYHFLKKNISPEDFNTLSLSGLWLLRLTLEHQLGIKKVLSVYVTLKKHGVKVFHFKYLSPKYLFKRATYLLEKRKKNKQYFT